MAFQKTKGSFLSSDGKTSVACYFYEPADREIIAVMQLSHGMCEYVERYEPFADYLCQRGIAFCGHDHLGHGATAPSKEDLGYFGDGNGPGQLVNDLFLFNHLLKSRYPKLPVVLLGHSMGSFIARLFLAKYPDAADAAIIMGTAGKNPAAAFGAALAKAICKKKGPRHRSALLQAMAFGAYNRKTQKRSVYDWLSKDQAIVEKYAADPWCSYTFTASAFHTLFTMVELLGRPQWPKAFPKKLPVYLVAGEDDPVGNYGKGVRETAQRLIEAGVEDVSLTLYPNDRHEILNETDREKVFHDIDQWIQTKIK